MNRPLTMLLLAASALPTAAGAQPPGEPTTILLRPAPEPSPALKYRLVPERRSLLPGNAANFYHRAIQLVIQNRAAQADPAQMKGGVNTDEQIARWNAVPIQEVPREEARKLLDSFDAALKEVELGARRATCDWDLDLRAEGINLLLPEIQETRSLARLVVLRVRLAILDGDNDAAFRWTETGLVLGRHAANGPTLIQALVGIAIDSLMLQCLEALIQVPGTPSLVWAFADRPRPFIDMRGPLEGERYLLEKELPELSELDGVPWGLARARRFTTEIERKLFSLAGGEPIPGSPVALPRSLPETARRLGIAAMAAKIYPEAKRALIARGKPAAEVEAMPVVQAATLYSIQEYQKLRDDSYKWMNVPYRQSYDRIDRPWVATVEQKMVNPLLTLFSLLTPALNSVRLASLRTERRLDALQCVEAIRLHADAHGGTLPDSLDEIVDAPVPDDPATGKPFSYRRDGDTAALTGPVPTGAPNIPAFAIDYRLKLAK